MRPRVRPRVLTDGGSRLAARRGHMRLQLHADVTSEVQEFYERYPYPRPVENLDRYRQRWQDPQRRRAEAFLSWPNAPYREDHSILIAGCGTSQAAKHALRWLE